MIYQPCDFCDNPEHWQKRSAYDFYFACKFHQHLKKFCPAKRFKDADQAPRKLKKWINKHYKRKQVVTI